MAQIRKRFLENGLGEVYEFSDSFLHKIIDRINKIKQFPLLGKFYTLPFLMNLNEFMKKFGQNIDLESIESFDQANILENILLLLERVCKLNETDFQEFKNIKAPLKQIECSLIGFKDIYQIENLSHVQSMH